jgi:hypothetical protein
VVESKKRAAALGIVGGFLVNMSGSALQVDGAVRIVWASVGFGLFAWGAISLAEAKGYGRSGDLHHPDRTNPSKPGQAQNDAPSIPP